VQIWYTVRVRGVVAPLASASLAIVALAIPAHTTTTVTFARDVAPLVYRRCAGCHHDGGAGPFPLTDYASVRKRAGEIVDVTARGVMPPWKPAPGIAVYLRDRSLTLAERTTLARWRAAGMPRGDQALEPAPPAAATGWPLGPPSATAVLSMPYPLPAEGRDVYRNLVLRVPIDHPVNVAAWDLRTGNRAVHHAILGADVRGWARARDGKDGAPGYPGIDLGQVQSPDGFYLVWTPGKAPAPPVPGVSWRLEPGTDLVLQLHLTPTGKPEAIAPQLALYFTDEPPRAPRATLRVGDRPIDLAPGVPDARVSDQITLGADVRLLGLFPHAHYVARGVRVWATLPDGREQALLRIDDWDPDWQDVYDFADPPILPEGTRIGMEFRYDNSDGNPRNPNHPPARVVTGERAQDEMGNVTLQVAPVHRQDLDALRESKYRWLLTRGEDARVRYNLGNVLMRRGRDQAAIAEYERALALDPRFAPAHGNLANLLVARGDLVGALAHYQAALATGPETPDTHIGVAGVLSRLGRPREAAQSLRRALELRPGYPPAERALAQLGIN
jgi:hypothetical protein